MLVFLLTSVLLAQIEWRGQSAPAPSELRGGLPGFVWGEGLWRLDAGKARLERLWEGSFGPAGCRFDNGIVLHESPTSLVHLTGVGLQFRRPVDNVTEVSDCRELSMLGHSGLLVAHRGLQVRFYEPGPGRWPYREIYSFYTASFQSGLVPFDVDGDGRDDLFSGNYWIQSPAEFDLPWRLFAINTYNDTQHAAHVRLGVIGGVGSRTPSLLVSQGRLFPGKLALFERTADVRQLWKETRLDGDLALDHPDTLAVADLDLDGREDFIVAENAGPASRLWWWRQSPHGRFSPLRVAQGEPVRTGWIEDVDKDGRPDIVAVSPRSIRWFRNLSLR